MKCKNALCKESDKFTFTNLRMLLSMKFEQKRKSLCGEKFQICLIPYRLPIKKPNWRNVSGKYFCLAYGSFETYTLPQQIKINNQIQNKLNRASETLTILWEIFKLTQTHTNRIYFNFFLFKIFALQLMKFVIHKISLKHHFSVDIFTFVKWAE